MPPLTRLTALGCQGGDVAGLLLLLAPQRWAGVVTALGCWGGDGARVVTALGWGGDGAGLLLTGRRGGEGGGAEGFRVVCESG